MKTWLPICGLLSTLLLPPGLECQLICNPPEMCSCDKEEVSPNLTIGAAVRLTGVLFDASGAPISFKKTVIEVRIPISNKVVSSAVLDEKGRFDLGTIPAGKFRFVAFWSQGKKASRLPLFDQPKALSCTREDECNFEILLVLHGTDQEFESCPPK